MASTPAKRPPRKARPKRSSSPPKRRATPPEGRGSTFADPQTVEAVRRATLAASGWLEGMASTGGRAFVDGAAFTARWIWPRLRDGVVFLVTGFFTLLAATARWLWTQRSAVTRVGHRGLWWGALAILLLVGRALLSADGDPELLELAMTYLVAGLSMSLFVLVGAPETRMRVAAFALASGHGSLAALTWVVVAS